ncbi:hypothetical protein TNCV_4021141 [Trichonephila clavipes]|nr:hypothetical protein TNCV_4021141 [Trichonephila clavipes]
MALATSQESKGQKPYERGELKNSNGPTGMSEETLLFNGAPFLFTHINKSTSEIKETILDVRLPKQKKSASNVSMWGKSAAVVRACRFAYGNPSPQIRTKIGRKSCMENVRVMRPLGLRSGHSTYKPPKPTSDVN